jgi:hypothetical protein
MDGPGTGGWAGRTPNPRERDRRKPCDITDATHETARVHGRNPRNGASSRTQPTKRREFTDTTHETARVHGRNPRNGASSRTQPTKRREFTDATHETTRGEGRDLALMVELEALLDFRDERRGFLRGGVPTLS